MVRLKEFSHPKPHRYFPRFQFHYGSVKSSVTLDYFTFPYIFQFHYGSVKRAIANNYKFRLAEFQFHYGSVKRQPSLLKKPPRRYFNSTMVRLKAASPFSSAIRLINFNSTMVRLKALTTFACINVSLNFNSTMVRLKVWFHP